MEGMVTMYSDRKGFGFILGEDNNNYFVHYSSIAMDGFQTLQIEDTVEFDPAQGKKGLVAKNVKKV
jgi:CspA family cold shock protein